MPSISGLIFSPTGVRATLVDISTSGLLAECRLPLKVGQAVKVVFVGTFAPQSVDARVVRSCVASMTSTGFRYHVGIAFKVPIDFKDDSPPENRADNGPARAAVANPPQPSRVVNRW